MVVNYASSKAGADTVADITAKGGRGRTPELFLVSLDSTPRVVTLWRTGQAIRRN